VTTTYDQATVTYDQSTLTYQGLPTQFDGVAFAVEMAFGYEPLDDDPSWESVTPYVRGFEINRGRNSEFSTYGPGTVSIALDNRDRRFDPEHTTGPYFGELNPMVPVRVQATYSGVTYIMFYGFVQGWPTVYNQSNTDAVATVTAIDATRLLSNVPLPLSALVGLCINDGSKMLWTLQDLSDANGFPVAIDVIGGRLLSTSGPFAIGSFNVGEYPVGTNRYLYQFSTLQYEVNSSPLAGPITSVDVPYMSSMEMWFDARIDTSKSYLFYFQIGRGSTTGSRLRLLVEARHNAAVPQWEIYSVRCDDEVAGLYGSSSSVTSFAPVDGFNHFCATRDGSNFLVYLNGSVIRTLALTSTPPGSFSSGDTVGFSAVSGINNTTLGVSTFSCGDALSAPQVVAHYNAGLGYTAELSSARLGRALDDAGWPTVWRDVETGVQPVGSYRPASLPAVRYMEQVDNAEQGALFVNREGEVEFRSRTTTDAVQVVGLFDDSGTDLPFANVSVDSNTVDAIRNRVDGQYAVGTVTAIDTTSVAAYGEASESVDLQLIDDPSVAQSIVDARLARAKDPRTRITRLDINVRRDPAGIVPVVAALDLSDDVTVSLTPTGVGSALWRAVRVQGITHRVTPQSWDVSLYLAPGPVNTNGPLLILDDGTYGVLDSNKLG
jgi:hypothetical protein